MALKVCRKCHVAKPLSAFHKSRPARGERSPRGGMGVGARCRDCAAETRKPGLLAERAERGRLAALGLKHCRFCRQTKPFAEFHVSRAQKDGRAHKCAECVKAYLREWQAANPTAFSEWHAANRGHRNRYSQQWREANAERRAAYMSAWLRANAVHVAAKNAKRMAAKLRAAVAWADQDAIRAIYAEAARLTAETGVRHEVDHIYPLQGETVCGLHCEANLQILTKTENIRKLNRMPFAVGMDC